MSNSMKYEDHPGRVKVTEQPGSNWSMLMVGLAIGFLGIHLAVVRPMRQQMRGVERQLVTLGDDMEQLVGAQDDIWKANDLLTGIRFQQNHIEDANKALKSIERFCAAVEAESRKAADVMGSLDRLRTFQGMLVDRSDLTDPADRVLEKILSLQQQLIDQRESVEEAQESLERLASLKQRALDEALDAEVAESGLDRLSDLKFQILNESDRLEEAAGLLKRFAAIKNAVIQESDDLDTAEFLTEKLLTLKDRIIFGGGSIHVARDTAESLMALRDNLNDANSGGLEAPHSILQRLIALTDKVVAAATGTGATKTANSSVGEVSSTQADHTPIAAIIPTIRERPTSLSNRQTFATNVGISSASDFDFNRFLEFRSLLRNPAFRLAEIDTILTTVSEWNTEALEKLNLTPDTSRTLLELTLADNTIGRVYRIVEPLVKLSQRSEQPVDHVREANRRRSFDAIHGPARGVPIFDSLPDEDQFNGFAPWLEED